MRKLWLTMLCTLTVLGTATASEALISVRISDGTTILNGVTLPGLTLSQAINTPIPNADTTTTLNILRCTTPPCTVLFPSGTAFSSGDTLPNPLPAGNTFKIQDVSSTNRARIEVLDAATSSDRVSFKGVKFTSLVAGKTLTVTYSTASGDLRALTSAQASSYFVSAAFSGSFKTSTGLRATACKAGTVSTDMDDSTDACARLSVTLNGTGVDGQGNSVSATVAVACSNAFPTLNPCGTNGSWTATTGTFTGVNDGRSLSCPNTCSPSQVATLTGKFNGANEVLQLTASLNGVMSNVTDQDGGVEEAAIALGDEVGLDRWVTTSPKDELCKAVAKSPLTTDTRNITSGASLPISFEYWCGKYSPAGNDGIPLVSLADSALIPGAAGAKYMASRETFLPTPGQLKFKDIQTLSFFYDVALDLETNPTDIRLDPVFYSDCQDGSIRLEIQLVDSSGADQGTLKVYLGSKENPKGPGCAVNASIVGPNITNNPDARVDASGLVPSLRVLCCSTFKNLQNGQIGNTRVRKIAFIVSRRLSGDDTEENFKVTFRGGNVNGITAQSSLRVVTDFVRVTPTSTNGVYIVITKLDSGNDPTSVGVVKVIKPSDIVISGGKFTTSAKVVDIQAEGGMPFAVSLCPNGTTENPTIIDPDPSGKPTAVGICIADNARFSFQ